MRSKILFGLFLLLPLAAASACSDDSDTDASSAGSGNTAGRSGAAGRGGSSGRAGNAEGGDTAGQAGESGGATAGSGPVTGEGGTTNAGAAGDADTAGAAGAADIYLSNGQTLKVLITVNQGEIAAAQTALPAAQAASVLDFAQMMITEHSAANAQLLALVSTNHIAPISTDVSANLEAESAALLLQLSTTSTASFDRVYMQSQVAAHQEVLTLIDTRLTPGVTDANLKTLLAMTRTTVSTHLTHAQAVLAAL